MINQQQKLDQNDKKNKQKKIEKINYYQVANYLLSLMNVALDSNIIF